MLPPRIRVDARRVLVEQLDVGHRADAGVAAFDQVVAEDVILREGVCRGRGERVDVVDAFAGVAALRRTGPDKRRRRRCEYGSSPPLLAKSRENSVRFALARLTLTRGCKMP